MDRYNNFSYRQYEAEVNKCLLCHDPMCTKACPENIPVGRILKSLYFENFLGASNLLRDDQCQSCSAPCERACVLAGSNVAVNISDVFRTVIRAKDILPVRMTENTDLSTEICGIRLENPFLLSSSVVGSTYDMCRRAFEAGWAGVSFKTICSFPQHEASPRFSSIRSHSNSFCGFKNIEQLSDHSVEENMDIFRRLRNEFPDKVIVASIMGQNEEEWTRLAEKCEKAGASLIECNFSCPNMESDDLGVTIGQSEELVEKFTRAVKRGTSLPVLAKLTPNITDMVPMALAAKRGGADGIAAINTINSITGVDIDTLVAEPDVHGRSMVGGYSGPAVFPVAVRMVYQVSSAVSVPVVGMGGVSSAEDVLEMMMAGATAVEIGAANLVNPFASRDIIRDLPAAMDKYGIRSLSEIIGAAH
jgi:dihydropyrimidine dehydrogenase (NAD+) subunit PreA